MKSYSVILLNYKNDELLDKTIENIKCNAGLLRYTIIVINVASSNFQTSQENVIILKLEENKGYAYGNNYGVRYVFENKISEYIVIMNPDSYIITKYTIDNIINKIENLSNYVIGGQAVVETRDKKENVSIRRVPDEGGMLIDSFYLLRKIFRRKMDWLLFRDQMPFKRDILYEVPAGSFFIVKTDEFFNKIKLFDEETFLYEEEIILGFKMKKLGYKFILDHESKVGHIQGISTGSHNILNFFVFKNMLRSRRIYCKKYLLASSLFINIMSLLFTVNFFCQFFYKKIFNEN